MSITYCVVVIDIMNTVPLSVQMKRAIHYNVGYSQYNTSSSVKSKTFITTFEYVISYGEWKQTGINVVSKFVNEPSVHWIVDNWIEWHPQRLWKTCRCFIENLSININDSDLQRNPLGILNSWQEQQVIERTIKLVNETKERKRTRKRKTNTRNWVVQFRRM
jgi:hypothetical protein